MNNADLVIALLLLGGFLMGFFQGSPRALLALGGWFIAFLAAAHLREPVGNFLADKGQPYTDGYAAMLAFGAVFIVIYGGILIAITFTYRDTRHLTRFNVADEFVAGVLGALGMLLVVTATLVILDSFYASHVATGSGEIGWISSIDAALDGSGIANALRSSLVPGLGAILEPVLPFSVRSVMR